MSWSLKLITIRGIPIRVHATFLLILAYAAYLGFSRSATTGLTGLASGAWVPSVVYTIAFVLLLFVCVVLHELGHSLVAQLFGVQVQDITLWPVGGVARMAHMPERPYQEFLITAAGPATNIFLAGVLAVLAIVVLGPDQAVAALAAPRLLGNALAQMNGLSLLLLLTLNNIILALFNLIPAFPMDGGRLLRALLAVVLPYTRATVIAATIGQFIAVLMIGFSLLTGNFTLTLVGIFVFVVALGERRQTTLQANFAGLSVRQAMQPVGPRVHPLETLGDVVGRTATAPQAVYLAVDGGRLAGLLPRADLLAALRRAGPAARVAQYLRKDVIQLSPAEPLEGVLERLGKAPAAVVVEEGQVIGLVSQADLMRLAEVLAAHPAALPRL